MRNNYSAERFACSTIGYARPQQHKKSQLRTVVIIKTNRKKIEAAAEWPPQTGLQRYLDTLKNHGNTLTAADAHGNQRVLAAGAL